MEEISQTLIGITGSRPVWNKGTLVKSVPDGIGQILLTQFGKKKDEKKSETFQVMDLQPSGQHATAGVTGPECPECGCTMEAEGGCAVCHTCGYSHCG